MSEHDFSLLVGVFLCPLIAHSLHCNDCCLLRICYEKEREKRLFPITLITILIIISVDDFNS